MNDYRPSDEELNAYIDGELSPDERARVAQAVANDRELADRIAALARLKSTVAGLADKPGMTLEDLELTDPAPKRTGLRIAASIVAAIILVGAVIAGFWDWRDGDPEAWVATAKSRHLAWLEEVGEEYAVDKLAFATQATIRRLEVPAHIPDMSSAKLTLTDAVYFRTKDVKYPSAQLRYTGRRGCRVSLTLSRGATPLDTALSEIDDGRSRGFYWRVGAINYALFATGMDATRFTLLARNVYLATRENQNPPEPEQQELRVASDTAMPCRA